MCSTSSTSNDTPPRFPSGRTLSGYPPLALPSIADDVDEYAETDPRQTEWSPPAAESTADHGRVVEMTALSEDQWWARERVVAFLEATRPFGEAA